MAAPGSAGLEQYRVAVSVRIWIVLGVLTGLVIAAGTGLYITRGKLAKARADLGQAYLRIRETDLVMKNALADKALVIKELSAQGNLIAQTSRGEEKARSELAAISSDAEAAEKRIAALTKEVKTLKARLAKARKSKAAAEILAQESVVLKAELGDALTQLEEARAELDRLRLNTEPYRPPGPGQPRPGPPPR